MVDFESVGKDCFLLFRSSAMVQCSRATNINRRRVSQYLPLILTDLKNSNRNGFDAVRLSLLVGIDSPYYELPLPLIKGKYVLEIDR